MSKNEDLDIASTTDMTGLMPTPARNAYEKDSYLDILPYTGPLNPGPVFPVTDHPVGNGNPYKFKEKFPDFAIPKTENKKRV